MLSRGDRLITNCQKGFVLIGVASLLRALDFEKLEHDDSFSDRDTTRPYARSRCSTAFGKFWSPDDRASSEQQWAEPGRRQFEVSPWSRYRTGNLSGRSLDPAFLEVPHDSTHNTLGLLPNLSLQGIALADLASQGIREYDADNLSTARSSRNRGNAPRSVSDYDGLHLERYHAADLSQDLDGIDGASQYSFR
jgi:hypothetical protein